MSDYLWDRRGADAEVEGLELSLGAFAYEGKPPLPAQRGAGRGEGPPVDEEQLFGSLRQFAYEGEAPVLPLSRPSPPLKPVPRPRSRGAPWRHARVTPLAFSVGLMLMGFGVAWSALAKERHDVRKGWNLVPVLVAAVDLSEGSVVTPSHVSQRSVPEQFVTASVVKPESASFVLGQKVQVAVAAGDPLLWSQFESARAVERLAARVLLKARALAVEVKGTAGVGGWLRPNDHVDVIGSFKDPQSNEQVAVTLLQNVNVLATGKVTGTTNVNLLSEAERQYAHVSLMLLPEEAELLVLAQELGNLTFTLRNEEDLDVLEERGRASIGTLLSGERTKVLQQRRLNTIQVIRGSAPLPAGEREKGR